MNPDFKDPSSTFNAKGVEHPVVGAHAGLAVHGHLRGTKDLEGQGSAVTGECVEGSAGSR